MHVRRNLAASLIGLLAGPSLLSACGGGSTSVADPPVSSSPTSSSPTTPPAHESPQHFIRRWAAAEKRMENTGKTGPYLAMSEGCKSCTQLANDVSSFYAAGGYVKWGGWQIVSIRPYSKHGSRREFAMKARAATTSYKESASGERRTLDGGLATDVLSLRRSGDAWQVADFTKLGS
jgi:hypothetical protein